MLEELQTDAREAAKNVKEHDPTLGDPERFEALVGELSDICAKWQVNQHGVNGGRTGMYYLCPIIPHSCDPNLVYSIPNMEGKVNAIALKDIEEGELLEVSYMSQEFLKYGVKQRRKIIQKERHFTCVCRRCVSEDADLPAPTLSKEVEVVLKDEVALPQEESKEQLIVQKEEDVQEIVAEDVQEVGAGVIEAEETAKDHVSGNDAEDALLQRISNLEIALEAEMRGRAVAEARCESLESSLKEVQHASVALQMRMTNFVVGEMNGLQMLIEGAVQGDPPLIATNP